MMKSTGWASSLSFIHSYDIHQSIDLEQDMENVRPSAWELGQYDNKVTIKWQWQWNSYIYDNKSFVSPATKKSSIQGEKKHSDYTSIWNDNLNTRALNLPHICCLHSGPLDWEPMAINERCLHTESAMKPLLHCRVSPCPAHHQPPASCSVRAGKLPG